MNTKAAVKLARLGKTDKALPALSALASAGDAAAAVGVVEILAFQGKWHELAPFALQFLAEPSVAHAGNVFTDVTSLVRRAARETGDRKLVARAAKLVPAPYAQMMKASLLRDLPRDKQRPARKHYDDAVLDPPELPAKELAAHLFALAETYNIDDELVRRWPSAQAMCTFDSALPVARALVRGGKLARAWTVLAAKLPDWYPVDHTQVAPVALLCDPELAPLMTKRRCATVLATSRFH